VGLNEKIEEEFSEIKREVYKRTSVSSTRLRLKNEDRSRCVRLYNK